MRICFRQVSPTLVPAFFLQVSLASPCQISVDRERLFTGADLNEKNAKAPAVVKSFKGKPFEISRQTSANVFFARPAFKEPRLRAQGLINCSAAYKSFKR
jgi:hypothetical protein